MANNFIYKLMKLFLALQAMLGFFLWGFSYYTFKTLNEEWFIRVDGNNWTRAGSFLSHPFMSGLLPMAFALFLFVRAERIRNFMLGEALLITGIILHFYAVLLVYGHTPITRSWEFFVFRDIAFSLCECTLFYYFCRYIKPETVNKSAEADYQS